MASVTLFPLSTFESRMKRRSRAAMLASEGGNYKEALKIVSRILREVPDCGWALFYRSALNVFLNRLPEAAVDFKALESVSAHKMLAAGREIELPAGLQGPEVQKRFMKSARRYPRLAWAQVLEAYLWRREEEWERSLEALRRARRLSSAPALLAFSARLKYVFRIPREAQQDMERAYKAAPGCYWICAWYAEIKRYSGDLDASYRLLNRAIGLNPYYYIAYAWRGMILRARGLPEKALENLNLAIRRQWNYEQDKSSWAWAQHERSLVKRMLGDFDGALKDLERAYRVNQRYIWTGDGLRPAGSKVQSLEALNRALQKHPRSWRLLAWRGFSLTLSGRRREALEDLNKALRLNSRWPLSYAWRAETLWALGLRSEAARDAERSIRLDPNWAVGHFLKGKICQAKGDWRGAEKSFGASVHLDPANALAWAERGRSSLVLHRHDWASKFLARARRLNPQLAAGLGF